MKAIISEVDTFLRESARLCWLLRDERGWVSCWSFSLKLIQYYLVYKHPSVDYSQIMTVMKAHNYVNFGENSKKWIWYAYETLLFVDKWIIHLWYNLERLHANRQKKIHGMLLDDLRWSLNEIVEAKDITLLGSFKLERSLVYEKAISKMGDTFAHNLPHTH